MHEECVRGTLSSIRARVAEMERVRGECVLLVAGGAESAATAPDDLDARIRALRAEGLGTREISARLAHETGRTRREVYQRVLDVDG